MPGCGGLGAPPRVICGRGHRERETGREREKGEGGRERERGEGVRAGRRTGQTILPHASPAAQPPPGWPLKRILQQREHRVAERNTNAPNCTMHSVHIANTLLLARPKLFAGWSRNRIRMLKSRGIEIESRQLPSSLRPEFNARGSLGGRLAPRRSRQRRRALNNEFGMHISYCSLARSAAAARWFIPRREAAAEADSRRTPYTTCTRTPTAAKATTTHSAASSALRNRHFCEI